MRKKYEQVGNAVPLSLGEAAGRALLDVIALPSVTGRQGRVECWNLDLLTKLTKRPRTVVNPPRMRNDTATETISDWYEGPGRMRRDALAYAASEVEAELRARMRLMAAADTPNLFEESEIGDGEGAAGDPPAEGEVQLAAAE